MKLTAKANYQSQKKASSSKVNLSPVNSPNNRNVYSEQSDKETTGDLEKNHNKLSFDVQRLLLETLANRISPFSYLAYLIWPAIAKAQPIVPADDGTNTAVTRQDNRFNIQGGRLSADGANLFHSFREFNLQKGQTASFSSTEIIKNILTRVTGGNQSFINGTLEVVGSNANLYIINPAGIAFGPNAQLNVPASFTATTASGIRFNQAWFSATGTNNYEQLIGTPSAFVFPRQPTAIFNAADLEVKPGQELTLMGGSVVNTGTLKAPGGQITIAAIPEEGLVRVSQEGHLLSLELPSASTPENNIDPLSIPEMLTDGTSPRRTHATGVTINNNGQLVLTGEETANHSPGTVVVTGHIDASSPEAIANRSLPPLPTEGGRVRVFGSNIDLSNAQIDVSGQTGGGTVTIGNAITNNSSNIPVIYQWENASNVRIGRDTRISARARENGTGGNVAIRSDRLDVSGQIDARGAGEGGGGSVEVSGSGRFNSSVELGAENGNLGRVQVRAENIAISSEDTSNASASQLVISETTVENLTTRAEVIMEANNDIAIENLSDDRLDFNNNHNNNNNNYRYRSALPPGSVTFVADADRNNSGSFAMRNRTALFTQGGSVTISGENLSIGRVDAGGGRINLTGNNIDLTGGNSSISSNGATINIQPRSPSRNIAIGSAVTSGNVLNLSGEDLAALADGFASINIGRLDGIGNINIDNLQISDPINFQSPGGTIEIRGEITGRDNAAIALNAKVTINNTEITRENGGFQINSDINISGKIGRSTSGINGALASRNSGISTVAVEQMRSEELMANSAFNTNLQPLSERDIRGSLQRIARETGKTPAAIYVVSRTDKLELILVAPNKAPIFKTIETADEDSLRQQMRKFIGGVSRPSPNNPDKYLSAAQQLYQWIIAPLESELESEKIDTLMFSLDPGMRTLPLAALHDGQQFLVEKYSLGLVPSINLTDTNYQNLKNSSVLAMGASQFENPNVVPLPAVPIELQTITDDWQGKTFSNEFFTLENLKKQRVTTGAKIVHLATHGTFDTGNPGDSYIQLWNDKLKFEQLRQLTADGERIELLVLSACETAFGSVDAELGFAGLAVRSGVKSVLASLWQVDDAGTLGLMSEFYRQLHQQELTVKAEALRQAQISMIEGDLRVEGGQLRSRSRGGGVPLPESENHEVLSLSHPYYWASFTMVGSPW
jgi:filamentous hemagglutinin family protein